MSETKKKMMQWLDADGNALRTPGSLVLAESTNETFNAHSMDTARHLTVAEKAALKHLKQIQVVDDIAARDALADPFMGLSAYVKNATADSSVKSGGAYYIHDGTAWIKTAEGESMDVVLQWANIDGKPASAIADIDDAVTRKHSHTNASSLDKLIVDADGLKVNGVGVGGIAIVSSPEEPPIYNGKLRLVVTEYNLPVA